MRDMAGDQAGRVWEDVRRALGRLVGRVASHDLPEAHSGIAVSVRPPASLELMEADSGTKWAECRPSALVRRLPPPSATAGGGGIDLATVATVIGANRALKTSDIAVSAVPCRLDAPPAHAWMLGRDMPGAPEVHVGPVRFVETPAPEVGVIFEAPPVRGLPVVRAALAKPSQEAKATWQFSSVRTWAGLAPVLRAPITCRRLPAPLGVSQTMAFAPERRMLAAASAVTEADVALIGVFPHVPLGAVHRLAVAPDGTALEILVRPDAVRRGAPVATVTVVLGRQRSTGKMLQAVRRGVGPERR